MTLTLREPLDKKQLMQLIVANLKPIQSTHQLSGVCNERSDPFRIEKIVASAVIAISYPFFSLFR